MIPELGHYALVLALVMALAQSIAPLLGAARNDTALMEVGRSAALAQFGFIAIAFICLTQAYVLSDFSVRVVASNSNSAIPLLYKISGVWGNHEGSMLLWVLILALFGAGVATLGRNLPPQLRARVIAVQAMIGVAFLAFILFTSNPFLRLDPAPLDGADLNPLLQDPGLAFHPPFLYLGYVGFSTTFSFAAAALIEGRVDPAWARWVRPWTLGAWSALTLGIALGSWWAYYELGWGGWWFWDPVENASFMPWLIGTALLHSAIVSEKRDALKTWTILLALLAFALSLIGTFLVRSGVLTSVHAFAVDPARGLFILLILIAAIGGSLALYAWRAPMLKTGGIFAAVSREGAMVFNNLFLCTACATVFLGTLYPLFLDAMGGGKVSVGPPFFNVTFVPLMVPLLTAVAVGPMLAWKRGDLTRAFVRLWASLAAAIIGFTGLIVVLGPASLFAGLGIALALWVGVGSLVELADRVRLFHATPSDTLARLVGLPRAAYGLTLGHLGLAFLVAGMTASSAWRVERIQIVRDGDSLDVAGYRFVFRGVREDNGPNYIERRGSFDVTRDSAMVTTLYPTKRFYTATRQATTEAAIYSLWTGDLYATIGDAEVAAPGSSAVFPPDGAAWAARIYYNPLVSWIWFGAAVMALGGVISLTDRRHRVGAPSTSRSRAARIKAQT